MTIMCELLQKCPDNVQRHTLLFEKITRRGPNAYSILLKICREHFADAALLLETETLSSMGYGVIAISEARNSANTAQSNSNQITNNNISASHMDGSNTSRLPKRKVPKLEPYTLAVKSKLNLVVKKSTKFHKHPKYGDSSTYSMQSRHRGVFFLVNIINFELKPEKKRNGADIDRDNLITLFRGMEFEIFYYENITAEVS